MIWGENPLFSETSNYRSVKISRSVLLPSKKNVKMMSLTATTAVLGTLAVPFSVVTSVVALVKGEVNMDPEDVKVVYKYVPHLLRECMHVYKQKYSSPAIGRTSVFWTSADIH